MNYIFSVLFGDIYMIQQQELCGYKVLASQHKSQALYAVRNC